MRLKGYFSIFFAAFFWGSSATAAKFLFEHAIPPIIVVESRVIIAAVLLLSFFALVRPAVLKIRWNDVRDFGLLGVIGVAGANYTYYMAIQETTVGIAILMQYTAPVLVALYMFFSKRERISAVKIAAIAISLAGCMVMLGAFDPSVHITMPGIMLGAMSALTFAFFNVFNGVARKSYSLWTAVTYTLVSAGIFWIVFDLFFQRTVISVGLRELPTLTAFSIISVLIPYLFYFTGLKLLVPSTAVVVSTLEPVVAIVTAFIFLGERLHFLQVSGGFLVISSVLLLEINRE